MKAYQSSLQIKYLLTPCGQWGGIQCNISNGNISNGIINNKNVIKINLKIFNNSYVAMNNY